MLGADHSRSRFRRVSEFGSRIDGAPDEAGTEIVSLTNSGEAVDVAGYGIAVNASGRVAAFLSHHRCDTPWPQVAAQPQIVQIGTAVICSSSG
jgi:hypothetical protein